MIPYYWRNQIVHTDCVPGMKKLPDESIPLTVTSPPFNKLRLYGGHPFNFEPIAEELYRIAMPGGVVVWNVQDQVVDGSETGTSSEQRLFFRQLGFRLHDTMIMVSNGQRSPSVTRYPRQFQYAFILSKGRPRTVNLIRDKVNKTAGTIVPVRFRTPEGGIVTAAKGKAIRPFGLRTNIWSYDVGGSKTTKDRLASDHPALMPEKMAEDHILSWSRPGDLVFDPMAGAATTCKMALLNHRQCLGMEIHGPYVEIARKRLELAKQERKKLLLAWLDDAVA